MGNNQKGFAPILILGVVVVTSVVLYFIYKNFGVSKFNLTMPYASPSPSPIAKKVTTTNDWKTFTDSKYHFSVMYPSNYDELKKFPHSENDDKNIDPEYKILDWYWTTDGSETSMAGSPLGDDIRIEIFPKGGKIPSQIIGDVHTKMEDITISGIKTKLYCGVFNIVEAGPIDRNGYQYFFYYNGPQEEPSICGSANFYTMLSTFKFTK